MMRNNLFRIILYVCYVLPAISFSALSKEANTETVYKLSYTERDVDADESKITMHVSNRFIRVDSEGDDSGYIIYDNKNKTIYSSSEHDRSILVIKEHIFSDDSSPVKPIVEYLQLADAPKVSGEDIYNYRVFIKDDAPDKNAPTANTGSEITCLEFQLIENIMPKVRTILKNYQKVISGQQVKMTDNKISEYQTGCFFVDQIYNSGLYYDKGLPVQEWHSNERFKLLTDYRKVSVSPDIFKVPEGYREFSIDLNSKTYIK